jgi:hypothetical protein
MRTMKQEYHLQLPVPVDLYKVDLEVVDRYIGFSAEALRLASFALAGYGFLITEVFLRTSAGQGQTALSLALTQNKYLLATGAVALGLSVATALSHRYYATECLTHFVRGMRLRNDRAEDQRRTVPLNPAGKKNLKEIDDARRDEEASLARDLTMSKWALRSSVTALAIGVGCAAWAFAVALAGLR